MNEIGCPMWDEYNQCCMWNRIEKIFQFPWEDKETMKETMEVYKECMEEMP